MQITTDQPASNVHRQPTLVPVLLLMDTAPGVHLLYVTIRLQLAEILANGPLTVLVVSQQVGANPHCLYRILQELTAAGVLCEGRDGRFGLTASGHMMRPGVPGSLYGAIVARGVSHGEATDSLLDAVRNGGIPFHRIYSANFFAWVEHHGRQAVRA